MFNNKEESPSAVLLEPIVLVYNDLYPTPTFYPTKLLYKAS